MATVNVCRACVMQNLVLILARVVVLLGMLEHARGQQQRKPGGVKTTQQNQGPYERPKQATGRDAASRRKMNWKQVRNRCLDVRHCIA